MSPPVSGKGPASRLECPDSWTVPQTFQLKITSDVLFSKHPLSQVRTPRALNAPSGFCRTKALLPFPGLPTRWQPWADQPHTLLQLPHPPSFLKKPASSKGSPGMAQRPHFGTWYLHRSTAESGVYTVAWPFLLGQSSPKCPNHKGFGLEPV